MISALLLIASATQPVALPDSQPLHLDDCGGYQIQQVMNQCFAEAYRQADVTLDAEWKRASSKAQELGDAWPRVLLRTQRTWLAWRDAQCDLASYETEGGSMNATSSFSCLLDLTQKRTDWLRNFVGEN